MDLNRLTQKSQEALAAAQELALRAGHTEVDGEHLLLALLEQPDGLAPRLLEGAGADPDGLRAAVEEDLGRRPRVTGPGAAPGQVMVTQRLGRLLDAAEREAQRLKDDYVSVEHLLLSLSAHGSKAGEALRAHGARVASITHAAGISSTGDPDLDRLLPLDEPYVIPLVTRSLINQAKRAGSRVIAVGTTVVRALEHAADRTSRVRSGGGVATGRVGAHTGLLIVDAIVSGMHERGTSHYELLRAFQEDDTLETMAAEAEEHDYHGHEFGDAVFIERLVDIDAERRGPGRGLGKEPPVKQLSLQ